MIRCKVTSGLVLPSTLEAGSQSGTVFVQTIGMINLVFAVSLKEEFYDIVLFETIIPFHHFNSSATYRAAYLAALLHFFNPPSSIKSAPFRKGTCVASDH